MQVFFAVIGASARPESVGHAVLRNLIIRRDSAVTEPSPLAKSGDERERAESAGDATND